MAYINPEITLNAIKKTKDFSEWNNANLVEIQKFLNTEFSANIKFTEKGREHAIEQLVKFKKSKTRKANSKKKKAK